MSFDKEQLKRLLKTKREFQKSPYFSVYKINEKQDAFGKYVIDELQLNREQVNEIKDFLGILIEEIKKREKEILGKIPTAIDGKDGLDADEKAITERIISKIPIPKDGKNYVLTEKDKEEIASKIDVPIVEVEKRTEVIREQPLITEKTINIENTYVPPTHEKLVKELEPLLVQLIQKYIPKQKKKMRAGGGGDIVIAGTGISISSSGGIKTISTSLTGVQSTSERVTVTQAGDNVTIDLTQLSNTYTGVLFIQRNNMFITPTDDYSQSGDTVTVFNAVASDVFVVGYTY